MVCHAIPCLSLLVLARCVVQGWLRVDQLLQCLPVFLPHLSSGLRCPHYLLHKLLPEMPLCLGLLPVP